MYQYNEFDHLIHDFNRYRYFFYITYNRYIRHNEWYELYQFLTKPKPKKIQITIQDIRLIRDLFDEVHTDLCGPLATVDTIHRAEWAHMIGLISADELDAVKTFWRKTC